jgi:hypothetical protein
MRNYKGSFYRTDEISKEPDQCPEWIDLLATKIRIDSEKIASAASKTAVEVARERNHQPSIYEMMSAIVSGQKPKYSSVEEAVQDYQRRTGLADYLKRAGDEDLSVLANQIITEAAKGVCSKCGCSYAECECDKNNADDDESEEDDDEKDDDEEDEDEDEDEDEEEEEDTENEDEDADDALDYGEAQDKRDEEFGDARDMTEEELAANPGKKKLISEAEEEKPELLVKNPSVEHFLTNIIETNIGIQLPAILHSLIETFSRDGVDEHIRWDEPLLRWINQKLISKGVSRNDTTSQIGSGVGTHVDYSGEKDSNKDPFTLLVPDKGSL